MSSRLKVKSNSETKHSFWNSRKLVSRFIEISSQKISSFSQPIHFTDVICHWVPQEIISDWPNIVQQNNGVRMLVPNSLSRGLFHTTEGTLPALIRGGERAWYISLEDEFRDQELHENWAGDRKETQGWCIMYLCPDIDISYLA